MNKGTWATIENPKLLEEFRLDRRKKRALAGKSLPSDASGWACANGGEGSLDFLSERRC
jgi:hypothetical protein